MPTVLGFDLETTGLSAENGHRIIEFAGIVHDLHTGKALGKFEQRIDPKRSIDPKAQSVHKISLDDLRGKPIWADVAPKVAKLFSRVDMVVAHNGIGFDLPFLLVEMDRVGIELPDVEICDTMVSCKWATPDGKPPSLKELANSLGFIYDTEKVHSALYDVALMMQCFFKARQDYPGFLLTPLDK